MKTINVYEVNEEVLIKATVRKVVVDDGTIKYSLRNKATGIDDSKFLYTEDQIFPVEKSVKTNDKKTDTKSTVKTTRTVKKTSK